MTDFGQNLEPRERAIFQSLADQVLELQESVMLQELIFSRLPVYGERGQMLREFHDTWSDLVTSFLATSDTIYHSLAHENDVDAARTREIEEMKRAARLYL